jgi:hypothetical protein
MDRRDFLTGVVVTVALVPLVETDEELWREIMRKRPPTSWDASLGCMQRAEFIRFRGNQGYVFRNREGVYCGVDWL